MMKKVVGYVGLILSLTWASQAGQYWWSGNGTTLGGNGTWNTTSTTNWGTSVAGPFNMSWPNGGGDEAVFTNTSGTVTLGTTVNLNAMTFTANNVMTFNSGTLNFGSAAATLSISNDANVTLNSALAGSGTLSLKTTKNTWGRGFTLYGNNSAFTGKLVVQKTAGTYYWLYATNDFNFGAVPVVYTADALTLDGVNLQNASSKVIDIPATRGITLGSGGLTFYNGALGTISLNSMITGSGGLTLDASTGVINLNNTNSFAGTLSLYGGKTVINIDNALPHGAGKGDVWFRCWNSAVTLDLNGHVVTIGAVYDQGGTYGPSSCIDNSAAGSATLIVGDGNRGDTFPRTIKNTGGALSLIKIGTGTQTLSGFCTYTGTTTVNGGTLTISGTNSASSGMVVSNAGTLVISGLLGNAVPLTVNAGGTLRADLLVNTNGVFNSASALTLAGGTLNVKGKNSGTSMTALGNLNVDPASSTISLTPNGGSGTTLSLSNAWTRQVGGTLLVDISAAGSTVTSSPTLTNGIIGGYAFVKDGTGTGFATVSAGNVVRYTGATALDAAAAAGNLDGTVNYVVTNSVALSGSSATQTVNSLFFSGIGSFGGNVKVVVVGAGGIIQSYATWTRLTYNEKLTSGTGDLVFNILGSAPDVAAIVDNGATKVGLTKTGAGSLLINAGNTYSGNTVINQGALVRGSCIPNGYGKGDLLVNAGAYLEMGGGSGDINGLSQSTNNTGGTVQNTFYATQVTLTLGNGDASANFAGVIAGYQSGDRTCQGRDRHADALGHQYLCRWDHLE
jgi:autotransporter-associated beta strand protein